MATIMERTAPNIGRRMLLTGIAGLLLGGLGGGLVSWTIQHRAQSEGIGQAFPAVRPEVFSPEAARILSTTQVSFSPEAIRTLNGYAPMVPQAAFSPAFSPEAVRALRAYAPTATQVSFSPEAVRARNG